MTTQHQPTTPAPTIGVLLINLGTPDAPTPGAVRRYLRQFLSDPRVVELPAIIWQPILHLAVLPFRPHASARAYRLVWTSQGSPLAVHAQAQAEALQTSLGTAAMVRLAMRYGEPSIASTLSAMHAAGCRHIVVAPLYPQYCTATTASAIDAVDAALARMRWRPAVRSLPPYYRRDIYVSALAKSVEQALACLDFVPDVLLASFHGMPQRTRDRGDPYHDHCCETAKLLALALNRPVVIAFQSRFGRARWLGPATDAELARLAQSGVKRIAVIAPGFAADCLETLDELAIRGRQQFVAAGGEDFAYVPCLNASEAGMTMLDGLISEELAEWLQA